jgi:hypothetical protein
MSGLSNCRAFILIEDMLLVMRENEEKTNLSVWWKNAAFLLAFSLPLINLNIQPWGVHVEAWQCAALGYVFHDEH